MQGIRELKDMEGGSRALEGVGLSARSTLLRNQLHHTLTFRSTLVTDVAVLHDATLAVQSRADFPIDSEKGSGLVLETRQRSQAWSGRLGHRGASLITCSDDQNVLVCHDGVVLEVRGMDHLDS